MSTAHPSTSRQRTLRLALLAITASLLATGCVDWIPPDREVALIARPGLRLRVTNATSQPIAIEPALDHPDEAPLRLDAGASTSVDFGLYRVIRARLLRPTTQGWRADLAGEARLTLAHEGSGHYLDMDGDGAALRVRTAGGESWRFRIALDDCLLIGTPPPDGFDLRVVTRPNVVRPIHLCETP